MRGGSLRGPVPSVDLLSHRCRTGLFHHGCRFSRAAISSLGRNRAPVRPDPGRRRFRVVAAPGSAHNRI